MIEMNKQISVTGDCPRMSFLRALQKIWSTPNYEDFFFQIDGDMMFDGYVAAVVTLDVMHNHRLGLGYSLRNTVHIRSIGVANHMRGVGFLEAICNVLISVAEDSGVFIFGTAKPFRYEVPEIRTADEGLAFLERRGEEWEPMRTDKKRKAEARTLRDKYVAYGFQCYDSAGFPCEDRFWKRNSFGFASSVLDREASGDYFERHLCSC
jgi:hypothetical protein